MSEKHFCGKVLCCETDRRGDNPTRVVSLTQALCPRAVPRLLFDFRLLYFHRHSPVILFKLEGCGIILIGQWVNRCTRASRVGTTAKAVFSSVFSLDLERPANEEGRPGHRQHRFSASGSGSSFFCNAFATALCITAKRYLATRVCLLLPSDAQPPKMSLSVFGKFHTAAALRR